MEITKPPLGNPSKADLSPYNYTRWPHKIRIRNTPHPVHTNIERNLYKELKPNKVFRLEGQWNPL